MKKYLGAVTFSASVLGPMDMGDGHTMNVGVSWPTLQKVHQMKDDPHTGGPSSERVQRTIAQVEKGTGHDTLMRISMVLDPKAAA